MNVGSGEARRDTKFSEEGERSDERRASGEESAKGDEETRHPSPHHETNQGDAATNPAVGNHIIIIIIMNFISSKDIREKYLQ